MKDSLGTLFLVDFSDVSNSLLVKFLRFITLKISDWCLSVFISLFEFSFFPNVRKFLSF